MQPLQLRKLVLLAALAAVVFLALTSAPAHAQVYCAPTFGITPMPCADGQQIDCSNSCSNCPAIIPRICFGGWCGFWGCTPRVCTPAVCICCSCRTCKPGMYCKDGGFCWETCAEGTAVSTMGTKNGCPPCVPGTEAPTRGLASCLTCRAGWYTNSSTGYVNCRSCPAGWHQPVPGSQNCLPCAPSTYSTASGTANCTATSPGYYAPLYTMTEQLKCPAGQYQPGVRQASCIPCPKNTYLNYTGAKLLSECALCPAGYFSAAGSTRCSPCAPGSSSVRGGDCVPCIAGTYATEYATPNNCTECVCGTASAVVGATLRSTCETCVRGYVSSNVSGSPECVQCPSGMNSHAGTCKCYTVTQELTLSQSLSGSLTNESTLSDSETFNTRTVTISVNTRSLTRRSPSATETITADMTESALTKTDSVTRTHRTPTLTRSRRSRTRSFSKDASATGSLSVSADLTHHTYSGTRPTRTFRSLSLTESRSGPPPCTGQVLLNISRAVPEQDRGLDVMAHRRLFVALSLAARAERGGDTTFFDSFVPVLGVDNFTVDSNFPFYVSEIAQRRERTLFLWLGIDESRLRIGLVESMWLTVSVRVGAMACLVSGDPRPPPSAIYGTTNRVDLRVRFQRFGEGGVVAMQVVSTAFNLLAVMAGNPSSLKTGLVQQRSNAILLALQCAADASSSIDFLGNPTQLELGDDSPGHAVLRGTIVGNTAFMAGGFALNYLIGVLYAKWKRWQRQRKEAKEEEEERLRQSEAGESLFATTAAESLLGDSQGDAKKKKAVTKKKKRPEKEVNDWTSPEAQAAVGCPGWLFVLASLLAQALTVSALGLLVTPSETYPVWDRVLGAWGAAMLIVIMWFFFWRLYPAATKVDPFIIAEEVRLRWRDDMTEAEHAAVEKQIARRASDIHNLSRDNSKNLATIIAQADFSDSGSRSGSGSGSGETKQSADAANALAEKRRKEQEQIDELLGGSPLASSSQKKLPSIAAASAVSGPRAAPAAAASGAAMTDAASTARITNIINGSDGGSGDDKDENNDGAADADAKKKPSRPQLSRLTRFRRWFFMWRQPTEEWRSNTAPRRLGEIFMKRYEGVVFGFKRALIWFVAADVIFSVVLGVLLTVNPLPGTLLCEINRVLLALFVALLFYCAALQPALAPVENRFMILLGFLMAVQLALVLASLLHSKYEVLYDVSEGLELVMCIINTAKVIFVDFYDIVEKFFVDPLLKFLGCFTDTDGREEFDGGAGAAAAVFGRGNTIKRLYGDGTHLAYKDMIPPDLWHRGGDDDGSDDDGDSDDAAAKMMERRWQGEDLALEEQEMRSLTALATAMPLPTATSSSSSKDGDEEEEEKEEEEEQQQPPPPREEHLKKTDLRAPGAAPVVLPRQFLLEKLAQKVQKDNEMVQRMLAEQHKAQHQQPPHGADDDDVWERMQRSRQFRNAVDRRHGDASPRSTASPASSSSPSGGTSMAASVNRNANASPQKPQINVHDI